MLANEDKNDERWMRVALSLAKRGLGQVAPNPSVGCVIIKDGIVVGRGHTQAGGRPHAEVVALRQAGADASGATAYVTLEPCSHTGKTPPCAEALIEAGIQRAVVAVGDPDPRVNGQGIEKLIDAGVKIKTGVLEHEAASVTAPFFSRVSRGRPSFTLKLATTVDGKIALGNGESKWITGEHARRFGHRLRAEHDAILVGSGTVLADCPSLTCRLDGITQRDPVRIILDRRGRTVGDGTNPLPGDVRTVVVTEQAQVDAQDFETLTVEADGSLHDVAGLLGAKGLNSVLIEGGSEVAASFLRAGLVDRLEVFTAGKLIGSNGIGAVADIGLARLADAPHFSLRKIRRPGLDLLASYAKAE